MLLIEQQKSMNFLEKWAGVTRGLKRFISNTSDNINLPCFLNRSGGSSFTVLQGYYTSFLCNLILLYWGYYISLHDSFRPWQLFKPWISLKKCMVTKLKPGLFFWTQNISFLEMLYSKDSYATNLRSYRKWCISVDVTTNSIYSSSNWLFYSSNMQHTNAAVILIHTDRKRCTA